MLQEIIRLIHDESPLNRDALLFENERGDICDFHYHHHFPLRNIEAAIARRHFIRQQFKRLSECRLMIITLGLTEAWFDNKTGLYLNVTPDHRLVKKDPDRFTFFVLDFEEIQSALQKMIDEVRAYTSNLRFIITVSPIPLDATFTPSDVVVSTNHSKATLITAAREIAYRNSDIDYFPSYEMAYMSSRSDVWSRDQRHVTSDFVQKVMDHFAEAYVVT